MPGSDKVGAVSSEMRAAETNFRNCLQEFDTATQHIRNAVNGLAASWSGSGYQAFESAMLKWDGDMRTVGQDLEALTNAVHKADAAFQDLDTQISQAFSGF